MSFGVIYYRSDQSGLGKILDAKVLVNLASDEYYKSQMSEYIQAEIIKPCSWIKRMENIKSLVSMPKSKRS